MDLPQASEVPDGRGAAKSGNQTELQLLDPFVGLAGFERGLKSEPCEPRVPPAIGCRLDLRGGAGLGGAVRAPGPAEGFGSGRSVLPFPEELRRGPGSVEVDGIPSRQPTQVRRWPESKVVASNRRASSMPAVSQLVQIERAIQVLLTRMVE